MKTIQDLFDLWDTSREMASDCGLPMFRVHQWRGRKRIPPHGILTVIAAAKKKGANVTAEQILKWNGPTKPLPNKLPDYLRKYV